MICNFSEQTVPLERSLVLNARSADLVLGNVDRDVSVNLDLGQLQLQAFEALLLRLT